MDESTPEPALLLEAAGHVEIELAKNLLEQAGIPTVVQGPDFDVAELGVASHMSARGADLYVPAEALERARALLDEAWSEKPEG